MDIKSKPQKGTSVVKENGNYDHLSKKEPEQIGQCPIYLPLFVKGIDELPLCFHCKKDTAIKLFQDQRVRIEWDNKQEKWYFSIVDIIAVLTQSVNPYAYWRKLKERLKKEENESNKPLTQTHSIYCKQL
jgi:hypothetical protein